MKQTLLALLLLFSCPGFTQTLPSGYPQISDDDDTLWLTNDIKFIVDHNVKVGEGSTDDGSFKYIRISSSSWTHFSSTSGANSRAANEANSLPVSFTGLKMRIKKIKIIGNENRGHVAYLLLGGGTLTNYECDIVSAVRAGEITCNGCENLRKRRNDMPTAPLSTADELLKLKKLKDDGVITQDEFDAQKNKLLNK